MVFALKNYNASCQLEESSQEALIQAYGILPCEVVFLLVANAADTSRLSREIGNEGDNEVWLAISSRVL